MQKIIVSVTNDIVTDQRVHKVCNTLVSEGYKVLLIGRKLKNSLPLQNTKYATKRMKLFFNKGFLFYAEYNIRLFFLLLFAKKDILLSNDVDTVLPNYFISKLQNKKLVFDSHELFSEIPELVKRPFVKKVWLTIENKIIPKLKNSYTVSSSISKYYFEKYGANFSVVKNVPYRIESLEKLPPKLQEFKKQRIILYQGAVNDGRGLDLLINAIEHINNAIFVIIGEGDLYNDYKRIVNKKKIEDKVIFIGKIAPALLKNYTISADLGISLEEDKGLSYRYALPNKLFDYIQARVPVLVSDLPELRAIVEKYQVGEVVKSRKTQDFVKQIEQMLSKKKEFYKDSLEIAAKELTWENESQKLKDIFNNLS